MATERCRPPVQPIATTRCALPSARYCGKQIVEQRVQPLVEGVERPVAIDELDDPWIVARQRPQVGLVVGVGQEAHVEQQVRDRAAVRT